MTYEIKNNTAFGSIEIYFSEKPADAVLEALKNARFRWHGVKKCWYGYIEAEKIAALLDGGDVAPAEKPEKTAERLASLWERTRTDALPAYGTENDIKKEIREICTSTGRGYDRAAAQFFRKHLRRRFPEMVFSITTGGAGWLDNCNIRIKKGPYGLETVKGDPSAWDWSARNDRKEPSAELAAVLNYCQKLHDAANADDGDHYADYGARCDLYGRAELSSDYAETEKTDAVRADVEDFRAQKAAAEAAEAEAEARRIEEETKKREEEAAAFAERERIAAEAQKAAEASAVVVDLAEGDALAFTNLRGGFGKECSAAELAEAQAEKAEKAEMSDAVITRKVIFSDADALAFFEKSFLRDWSFLAGKGGTKTADARVKDGEAWWARLTAEQLKSVSVYVCNAVAVYLGDDLRYIVDPEGFNYARYVYTPTEATEQKSAAEYEAAEEAESLEKPAFYTPAPVRDQVAAADLKSGETFTAFLLNPWLCSVVETSGKVCELAAQKYAQYDDAARLDFIPHGKRKARRAWIYDGAEAVIFRGTLPPVPDSLKYADAAGGDLQRLRFAGMDSGEYLRDVVNYYTAQGFAPVVDTVQR